MKDCQPVGRCMGPEIRGLNCAHYVDAPMTLTPFEYILLCGSGLSFFYCTSASLYSTLYSDLLWMLQSNYQLTIMILLLLFFFFGGGGFYKFHRTTPHIWYFICISFSPEPHIAMPKMIYMPPYIPELTTDCDAGPTLSQHWVNFSCFAENIWSNFPLSRRGRVINVLLGSPSILHYLFQYDIQDIAV